MAEFVNRQISDKLVEQQLRDARAEAALRQEVWAILALLEAEIVAALKANDPTEFVLLARRRREVARLMAEELDPLIHARYARIADLLDAALLRLATHEAEVVQQVVNAATAEAIITELPSARHLRAGVLHGLFPSPTKPTDLATTGAEWWRRQGESLSQRVGDSLTIGVALEESLTTLTQRVRGTSEQGFQDGIMARARDDAVRLLTTQVTNMIGKTRVATADRNPGHGLMLLHSSRLDSRTSLLCIGRNGLRYEVGTHDPIGHSIPYLTGVPYHPS